MLEDVVMVLVGRPAWLLIHSGNTVTLCLIPSGPSGVPLGVQTTVVLTGEGTYCSGLLHRLQQGRETVRSTLVSEPRT